MSKTKSNFYSMVPGKRLKNLLKFGRDYSKPALSDVINEARSSTGEKKPKQWYKIVSVPMGGQNK